MSTKAVQLSDNKIAEMTLVVNKDGQTWAPRNPEARFLSVKGAQADESRKATSFLGDLWDKFTGKSTASKAADAQQVLETALSNASYDLVWNLTYQLQWDLYAIFSSGDSFTSDEKKAAAERVFSGFTDEMAKLMPLLLGEVQLQELVAKCAEKGVVAAKAGAKFSKDTKEHLSAIKDAHDKMGEHLAALEDKQDGGADDASENQDGSKKGAVTPEGAGTATADVPANEPPVIKAADEAANLSGIATVVATEVAKATAGLKTEFDTAVAHVRESSDAIVNAAKAQAAAAQAQVATLEQTVKALTASAREPSATGAVTTIGDDGETVSATGEPAKKGEPAVKGMSVVDATKALLQSKR